MKGSCQLYQYINENKLFCEQQYGFRSQHSTELVAVKLVDYIIKEMDCNKKVKTPVALFLDLPKAFDTPFAIYFDNYRPFFEKIETRTYNLRPAPLPVPQVSQMYH